MRAGFAQFTAFSTDAADNKVFEQVKLTMPVLAVGGEKSFGTLQAVIMRHVAINIKEAVVPGSGHWLMEESPDYTDSLVRKFLDSPAAATPVHATADERIGNQNGTQCGDRRHRQQASQDQLGGFGDWQRLSAPAQGCRVFQLDEVTF